MGKKSAPPPPDYAALAQQQGKENRDTAQYNAELNRVNQVTPYGTLTWSQQTGADGKPRWTQTVALSPEQQKLQEGQNALSQSYLNTANSGVGRVADAMAQSFDTSKLRDPTYMGQGGSSAKVAQLQTQLPDAGPMPKGPALQSAQAGDIARTFDTSGVRALPGNIDDTSRRRVEEAIMSRINPQYQQDEQALRTRLLNSGIEVGTDAYNREMNNFSQRLNDARMQAVLAGGQEESRQVGLQQGLQGQEFNQAYQKGKFAQDADSTMAANSLQAAQINNQGALAKYAADLQAQQQKFSQGLAAAGFSNNAADTMTQRQMQIDQLTNAMQLANNQYNNQASQQAMQTQAYLRSLPLNEINALRTGSQVQGPQFGSYYTNNANAAPIMDAGIAQGNYNLQANAQENAGWNALLGGMANMGAAYLGRPSDPRLKSGIVRIGTHPLGIGLYEYTIGGKRERGVMSTEVRQVMPHAVNVGPDGFDRVRYDLIGEV